MRLTLLRVVRVPWWVYLTLPLLLVFIPLRLIAVRRAAVRPYLCLTHRAAAALRPWAIRLGFLVLTALGWALAANADLFSWVPLVCLLGVFEAPGRLVRARFISGEAVALSGPGADFRASLPALDQADWRRLAGAVNLHPDLD